MRHKEVAAVNVYQTARPWVFSVLVAFALVSLTGCQFLGNSQDPINDTVVVGNASIDFGTVAVGSSKSVQNTVTNFKTSNVTIASVSGLGQDFQISGVSFPLVLTPSQQVGFSVQFQPSAPGKDSATVSLVGDNGQALASVSLTGNAVTQGQLTLNPSSVSFGNVKVGNNKTANVTLSNSGSTDLTVNQATLSGAGFSMSNLTLPLTLHTGDTTSITITFAPTGAGNFSGSVTFSTTAAQSRTRSKIRPNAQGDQVVLPLSGVGVTPGTLSANPASLAFGNVQVGNNSRLSDTLTNTGGSSVTISQANVTGAGFSISGLSLPVTLTPNQSVTFTAKFAPTVAGSASGTLAIVSDASNSPLNIPLSGTGLAAGSLTSTPSSVNFGNVIVGNSQTVPLTITNTGGVNVTISSASVSGSGFSYSGPNLPVTLTAGQSTTFNAIFTPTAAGASSGALTINSNAQNPMLTVPLTGTGVAQGQLTPNPTNLGFGNVQIGKSKTLTETLTNTGGSSLTISAASISGTGFSMSGLSLPLTLTAGQSTTFSAQFAPSVSGAASGSVSITSNGANPNLSIPLSGTGVTPGTLTANPTSLAFGNVPVGNSSNLSETLTNTGGSTVTISQANVSGAGFSISGLSLPATLTPTQSVTFTATFAPTAPGSANGTLAIVSDGSNSPLNIPLSGTGLQGQLSVSPATLNFGDVAVGSSSPLNGTLTATGASVTVSSASINSSEFALSGITLPKTIGAGQSTQFTVTFTPSVTGTANATLTFVSNASNSPTLQSLTGNGTPPASHWVDLTWDASNGAVSYNVYRKLPTDQNYAQIDSSDANTAYTDNSVSAGQTYDYVVTAVDANNIESGYSNMAEVLVPSP